MADTYTTNLNLTKPEPGAAEDTWGISLNADLDALDAIFSSSGTSVAMNLDGAVIDSSVIGGTTPAAGTFTTLTVDNITIDGTEIDSNTDLTIDAAGDITLDADGGDFRFKDAGTTIATYSNVGGDWYITANSVDKDIVFQGNDGGSTVQALKLDMSDAGTAIFNNKVAIGTSSPAANRRLHIVSAAQNQAKFERSGAATSHIEFQDSTTTNQPSMGGVGDNLTFNTAFTERVRIDSSGKVAINMTSPLTVASGYGALTVGGSTGGGVILSNSSSGHGQVYANSSQLTVDAFGGRNLTFQTNGSERARIDGSGNFLVGTTSYNNDIAGIGFGSSNFLYATRSSNVAASFGRLSNDGVIIDFRKDAAIVGSIGANGTYPYIGSHGNSGKGIKITDALLPATNSGGFNDADVNLGASNVRWKDLYLSGTANVGGLTSSGNILLDGSGNPIITNKTSGAGNNPVYRLQADTNYWDLQATFSNANDDLYFMYNGSVKAGITSSGSVGLGTSSPGTGYKLDITGQSGYDDILRLTAVGTNIGARINLTNTGTGVARINATNNSLALQTAGVERMRIDSSGRVGLGTSSPSHPLNVVNSGELQAEFSGYSHASSANNSRAGSGSIRLGSGVGTTGLLIDYTDQGQTLGLIKNEYVASGSSELRLQSPFLSFYTGTSAAERMRIDGSGNVLIGTSSGTAIKLAVLSSKANGLAAEFVNTQSSTGSGIVVRGGSSSSNYSADFRNYNNSSLMRIRGDGNVGIGTTSPNRTLNLHVAANDSNFTQFTNSTTGEVGSNGFLVGIGSAGNAELWNYEAQPIIFATSSSERMRITSDGKVGISTTSPRVALDVNGEVAIAYNATYGLRFYNQPNNNWSSIGNTETSSAANLVFKDSTGEAMRIASGNVGIGTTNNAAGAGNTVTGISLRGEGRGFFSMGSDYAARFNRNTNDGNLVMLSKDGTTVGSISTYSNAIQVGQGNVYLKFANATDTITPANGNGSNNDNAIDLGGSSARFKDIYFSGIMNPDDITSFINSYHATVANGAFIYMGNSGSITIGVPTAASRTPMSFRNPYGEVGTISTQGYATSYNTSSDYRLKENVDYDFNALERVAQLKPARFNFIADADTTVDGFIAHEVSGIVPEAIHGEKDAVDDEGNPKYQGIDQSKLVPLLTKAIQEQQTQIEALQSEINLLKGE